MATPVSTNETWRFGVYEVDTRKVELRRAGTPVKMRDQSFLILVCLLEHAGEIVTREELRRVLWPSDTFVDFEHSLNVAVMNLRDALGDSTDTPVFIETVPKRGYRFIAPVVAEPEEQNGRVKHYGNSVTRLANETSRPQQLAFALAETPASFRWWRWLVVVAVLAGGLVSLFWFRLRHQTKPLTGRDTIVLSDFDNKTGDVVFDDTLKQGLSIQLEQSPFLALMSYSRVNETLKLMGRSSDDRLTASVTREICLRTGSTVMVTGSIAELGSRYVIGLKAVNCNTGDVLAEAQEQAADKEAVLKALDAAAVSFAPDRDESGTSRHIAVRFRIRV